jgi:hypothetical protein
LSDGYLSFCAALWRSWLRGNLEVPAAVRSMFDLDAAPEPYLPFSAGPHPLVVLTTNPGATMPHQLRDAILSGSGPVPYTEEYDEAARALSAFYAEQLRGQARRRINGLARVAELAGYDGFLQAECCPFHSSRLDSKGAFVGMLASGGLLGAYVEQLRAFLRSRPVLVVSATSSRHSLSAGAVRLSPWIQWQADLVGLVPSAAEFVPLVAKGMTTTGAVLIHREGGVPKALVLMMGGNHLPAEAGLRRLAAALSGSGTPVQ